MKLNMLHEADIEGSEDDEEPPQWQRGFETRVDDKGPENHLVALRIRPVNNVWAVYYNEKLVASIGDFSEKWRHDRWQININPRYKRTKEIRIRLEDLLKQMIGEIKKARTARRADKIIMPVDPSEVIRGEIPDWAKKEPRPPGPVKQFPKVRHPKFGVGELMADKGGVYTIKFADGVKKIKSDFVELLP